MRVGGWSFGRGWRGGGSAAGMGDVGGWSWTCWIVGLGGGFVDGGDVEGWGMRMGIGIGFGVFNSYNPTVNNGLFGVVGFVGFTKRIIHTKHSSLYFFITSTSEQTP